MEDPEQPPSTESVAGAGCGTRGVDIGVRAGVRAPGGDDRAALARFGEAALDVLGYGRAELSVLLCDDRFIRDLNLRFRGIDAPTDVLSFEQGDPVLGEPVLGEPVLGDVVISLDTARRQARTAGKAEAAELRELLLHGILHLLGRDHADSEQADGEQADGEQADGETADEPMLQEQERLLALLTADGFAAERPA